MDYISFFEEKNFDAKSIDNLQKYIITNYKSVMYDRNSQTYSLKKLYFMFNLFYFIGLSDKEIEKLLVANLSLLSDIKEKILKFAYVWRNIKEYNLTDNSYYRKSDIKRVFLREQYLLNNPTRNHSPISYNCLTMADVNFTKNYGLSSSAFEPNYLNLLVLYVKGENQEEKEANLERFILAKSIEWYRLSFLKTRGKHV